MAEEKLVTKADLRAAALRHNLTLQLSWNYERMQALGFAWSMIPILKKIHKNKDDYFAALKRHMVFYNTQPTMSSLIFGAVCAVEEQEQGEVGDSLKVALMGPLAGIGDTIVSILTRPIVGVFAASFALSGSLVGPLLFLLMGFFWYWIRWPLFWLGYSQGINVATEVAQGGRIQQTTAMASIMGVTVIGGFVPSILAKVISPLKFTQSVTGTDGNVVSKVIEIQGILDSILPYMLPIAVTAIAYWMLTKLKWKPLKVLGALAIVSFVLSIIGVL